MIFWRGLAKSPVTVMPLFMSGRLHSNCTCFPAYGDGKRAHIVVLGKTIGESGVQEQDYPNLFGLSG